MASAKVFVVVHRSVDLNRFQILAHRRRAGGLDTRLPAGSGSLRVAAWAGLQDSAPRAALLSIHARVEGAQPDSWDDPSLLQVWGPRFTAYVIAQQDRAVFTLGRLPDDSAVRAEWYALADRLEALLGDRQMSYGDAGHQLGINPNALRCAAPTGRVVMRWDGANRPTIWMVPQPDIDPHDARLELARRYLHVLGPGSGESFADWAGIAPRSGRAAFEALAGSLTSVHTPAGRGWILSDDEESFRATHSNDVAPVRLLPSGDTFCLVKDAGRELLVADPVQRRELWPSRVWPGAILVEGDLAGTWRRCGAVVTINAWPRLAATTRDHIEHEAMSLPLPDLQDRIRVQWMT